jgi:hypothetical protein
MNMATVDEMQAQVSWAYESTCDVCEAWEPCEGWCITRECHTHGDERCVDFQCVTGQVLEDMYESVKDLKPIPQKSKLSRLWWKIKRPFYRAFNFVRMFFDIVWREDGADPEDESHRMSIGTALAVAKIVWID